MPLYHAWDDTAWVQLWELAQEPSTRQCCKQQRPRIHLVREPRPVLHYIQHYSLLLSCRALALCFENPKPLLPYQPRMAFLAQGPSWRQDLGYYDYQKRHGILKVGFKGYDSAPGSVPKVLLVERLESAEIHQGPHEGEEQLGEDAGLLLGNPAACTRQGLRSRGLHEVPRQ